MHMEEVHAVSRATTVRTTDIQPQPHQSSQHPDDRAKAPCLRSARRPYAKIWFLNPNSNFGQRK